jgi:hypothetical protein
MSPTILSIHLSTLQPTLLLPLLFSLGGTKPLSNTNCFLNSVLCINYLTQAHSQCSEPFYRDQLASDIHAEPSTSAAERKAMMNLLKRFEEDNLGDPFATTEENADDDGEDELEQRMAGIDLGQF